MSDNVKATNESIDPVGEQCTEEDALAMFNRLEEEAKTSEEPITAEQVKDALPTETLITLSQEDMDKIIHGVSDIFADQLKQANDRFERLTTELESKSAAKHLENRGEFMSKDLKISTPRSFGPPDHMSAITSTARKTNDLKHRHLRFVNNDPNIRSLRRAQGYNPVIDDAGNEYRYMDEVLMQMPEAEYQETIVKPKMERKEFNRRSVESNFKDKLQDMGVKAEGEITYDKGDDELNNIDQVAEVEGVGNLG